MFFCFSLIFNDLFFEESASVSLFLLCYRNDRCLTLFLLLRHLFLQEADKHLEGFRGGDGEVYVAAIIFGQLAGYGLLCVATGQPDCADRNLCRTASRTCCSGAGDGEVHAESLDGSLHHFLCHFLTHGGILLYDVVRHAQEVLLHVVGVGDDATLKVTAESRDLIFSFQTPFFYSLLSLLIFA